MEHRVKKREGANALIAILAILAAVAYGYYRSTVGGPILVPSTELCAPGINIAEF